MRPAVPDIQISFSKGKSLAAIGVFSLILSGLFFLFYWKFSPEQTRFFLTIFLGGPLLIIVSLYKIFKGKPLIKLSPDHLWWKGEITDDEFLIPWSEIQHFEFNNGYLFNKGILVFVKHPERFLRGNYATIQKQREKIKAKGTYLAISIGFIEQSEGEMLALLNNYLDVIQNKRGAVVFPLI